MESYPMDFRAQRYRDRLRAEGRSLAVRTARRTRDILDRYVSSRRNGEQLRPEVKVLWGRIFFVLAALVGLIWLLVGKL
jgi:hypothetical protein